MSSSIFTAILGIASVFFFYQGGFLVAVILLSWALFRIFTKLLFEPLVRNLKSERQANCVIDLSFSVEEILRHPIFDDVFSKLKKSALLFSEKEILKDLASKDDWVKLLLENYKKKFKKDYGSESVRFNIKNGLLWENDKIQYDDVIHYEIYIPYSIEKEDTSWHTHTGHGLTIRVLVANGILKLQVGDFDKEISPDVLREGGLAIYQKYATITSFPLIYFPFDHEIPAKYFNLSHEYFRSLHEEKGITVWMGEWKKLMQDVENYNYLCEVAHKTDAGKKWKTMLSQFEQKREKWLKGEGFIDVNAKRKGEEYDYFASELIQGREDYSNKYLTIHIANFNNMKDLYEKYTYSDYYEERP